MLSSNIFQIIKRTVKRPKFSILLVDQIKQNRNKYKNDHNKAIYIIK